jgi:uncharacterized protein with HEPN domain
MSSDVTLLRTMLLAIEHIHLHHSGTCSDFTKDRATIYELIMLGEAAKDISPTLKTQNPEIPWGLISGTRNRLAHDYEEISYALVHEIVNTHLPKLQTQIETILARLESSHG